MANIGIFYFSGTGNTALVAELLQQAFQAYGHRVTTQAMDTYTRLGTAPDLSPYDFVGFGHPVIGLGCTRIATDFARLLPELYGKKGFVFQCCGDPHWINNNASKPMIRILKQKGIEIIHESQYAMAVNFIFRWEDALVRQLYEAARSKSRKDAGEILSSTHQELSIPWLLRGLCRTIHFIEEELGARQFGLSLRANDSCTGCGDCKAHCPTVNISMNNNRPRFGSQCIFCMRCVYNCPADAIHSRLFGFAIVKDYNGGTRTDSVVINPENAGDALTENTRGYYRHIWEYIKDCNVR